VIDDSAQRPAPRGGAFRAALRARLGLPLVPLATLAFGLAAIAAGLLDRSGSQARRLAGAWARLVLGACGVRVGLVGRENVPSGPAVYAANHGSALDIPILFGYLPVEFRVIHKRSLYLLPIVGQYLKVAGHIGIDRGRPFQARRSLADAARRIRGGASVVVFPEGTRSPGAEVQPFKRGSFMLAASAGVPVVPVSLVGVKRLAPRGLLRLRSGSVQLKIHAPLRLEAAADAGQQLERIAAEAQRIVAQGCREA
jgi:1-acyl-sn-glycerol-3-phosphate acyltransferase